jgi:hypothetical protein
VNPLVELEFMDILVKRDLQISEMKLPVDQRVSPKVRKYPGVSPATYFPGLNFRPFRHPLLSFVRFDRKGAAGGDGS